VSVFGGMQQDRRKIARVPSVRGIFIYVATSWNKSVCSRFRHTMPRAAFVQR